MSDLVTGEAVVLGVEPAKLPSRMLAKALDLLTVFVLYIGLMVVLALTLSSLDGAAVAAVALTAMVLVMVGLPMLVETLSHGRSPGKVMMGLRVVRSDGGPIRFRHALVRGLLGFFEILAFFAVPATLVSLFSAQGRRLGDIFAGTLVVRERIPGGRMAGAHPLATPPVGGQLPGLAQADLSAVPEPLWLAVRQFLGRAGQLYPEIALNMAGRLAADLAARIGEAPPQHLHPAGYLSAVLAERQRREWQRAGMPPGAGPTPGAGMPPGPGISAYPGVSFYPGMPPFLGTPSYPGMPSYPAAPPYPGMPAHPAQGSYPGMPPAGVPYPPVPHPPAPYPPALPLPPLAPPPVPQAAADPAAPVGPSVSAALPTEQPTSPQTPTATATRPAAPASSIDGGTGFAPPA